MNSIVSDIIDKSSQIAKAESSLELFWALIIAVILFIVGYNLNISSTFQKTIAKIIDIECNTDINNKNNYICTMNVQYIINNKKYVSILNTNTNKNFNNFKNIEIYYNTLNPREIFFQETDNKFIAFISFIISVFLILSASTNFYLTFNNDDYAFLSGLNIIFNKISNLFKK